MLNGMLWIARSGCQWRDLPECYGKWHGLEEYQLVMTN
jgi:transposase